MRNQLKLLSLIGAALFMTVCGCKEANLIESSTQEVFIEIDAERLVKEAQSGDEVPDYVAMYNGEDDFNARTNGEANLVSTFAAGDEVIWTLGTNENIHLLRFEFFVVEGEDFFALPGGSYPVEQEDGNWKAVVSPSGEEGATLKYNIYFEIEGVGTFWWDPLAKVSNT